LTDFRFSFSDHHRDQPKSAIDRIDHDGTVCHRMLMDDVQLDDYDSNSSSGWIDQHVIGAISGIS
jgi:hypothetical protein